MKLHPLSPCLQLHNKDFCMLSSPTTSYEFPNRSSIPCNRNAVPPVMSKSSTSKPSSPRKAVHTQIVYATPRTRPRSSPPLSPRNTDTNYFNFPNQRLVSTVDPKTRLVSFSHSPSNSLATARSSSALFHPIKCAQHSSEPHCAQSPAQSTSTILA